MVKGKIIRFADGFNEAKTELSKIVSGKMTINEKESFFRVYYSATGREMLDIDGRLYSRDGEPYLVTRLSNK